MSQEAIDLPEFLDRVQDDKELLLELLDIFSEDYQQKRRQLGESVRSQNFEDIKNIAHSMKGASGNISAKPVREIFLTLEIMGKNNDLSGIDDLLIKLDARFEELRQRIATIKEELG